MWHVQRFQSMKHTDLKHVLQLFPFRSSYSYFEATVKQQSFAGHKRRRRHNWHRHYRATHTCLSDLSAIIWITQIYHSALCTSTLHCIGSAYSSFRWGGLVKSAKITSSSCYYTTAVPCLYVNVSVLQNKVHLLFWDGTSAFIGLNMKHKLTKKFCSGHTHVQTKCR